MLELAVQRRPTAPARRSPVTGSGARLGTGDKLEGRPNNRYISSSSFAPGPTRGSSSPSWWTSLLGHHYAALSPRPVSPSDGGSPVPARADAPPTTSCSRRERRDQGRGCGARMPIQESSLAVRPREPSIGPLSGARVKRLVATLQCASRHAFFGSGETRWTRVQPDA